jgi:hypothetical protein
VAEEDNELCDVIKVGTKSVPSLPWPYVSPDPVNEYDTTEKLFCKAFPWLFPGGVGDFNDYRDTLQKFGNPENWQKESSDQARFHSSPINHLLNLVFSNYRQIRIIRTHPNSSEPPNLVFRVFGYSVIRVIHGMFSIGFEYWAMEFSKLIVKKCQRLLMLPTST